MANKVLDEAWKWMWILLTGQEYPDGDADAWRAFGQRWKDLGEEIQNSYQNMTPAVVDIGLGWSGDAGNAFQNGWSRFISDQKAGPTAYMNAAQQQYAASQNGAMELEFSQLMLDMIVGLTIVEFLIGVALSEFGGEALSAEAVAVARPLVARILERLGIRMSEAILDKMLTAVVRLATGAALGAFNMAAANALAQGIQVSEGTRKGIDWGDVGRSAEAGALGGLAGVVAGAGMNRLFFGKAGAGGLFNRLPSGLKTGLPGKLSNTVLKLTAGGVSNIPTIAAMNPEQFFNDLKNHPFQTLVNDFVGGVALSVTHSGLEGAKNRLTGEGRAPATASAPETVEAPTPSEVEVPSGSTVDGAVPGTSDAPVALGDNPAATGPGSNQGTGPGTTSRSGDPARSTGNGDPARAEPGVGDNANDPRAGGIEAPGEAPGTDTAGTTQHARNHRYARDQ